MKVIIIGLGNQGKKRALVAGDDLIATVDPVNPSADYANYKDVPIDSYDAALVCTGDVPKIEILSYLISNKKHVLVEKPLISFDSDELINLRSAAEASGSVCYSAYNHRFEPHFINIAKAFKEGRIGKIYSLRMFYGNGTARIVRDSAWRDEGAGILTDLGSHLLDTLDFWFDGIRDLEFDVVGAFNHENKSFDHVILHQNGETSIHLEMSMLSWRNSFECHVFGEKGSLHIDSLCKWGPSKFIQRERILPSGRPTETIQTEIKPDPTWELEYQYFTKLCKNAGESTLSKDIWLNDALLAIANKCGVSSILNNNSET